MNFIKKALLLSMLFFINEQFVSAQIGLHEQFPTNNKQIYTDSRAKTVADSLYLRIIQGEKFDSIAYYYSQDPASFSQGGILRRLTWDILDDDYRDAVTVLKINEISKPFKTWFGYHIVQLLEKDKDTVLTKHILLMVVD